VSADGRFATFGPSIRDMVTGAVERYAFDVDGTPVLTYSASEGDVMSEDGRYVVFLDEIYEEPRLLVRDSHRALRRGGGVRVGRRLEDVVGHAPV
jgi:hypothetical protein